MIHHTFISDIIFKYNKRQTPLGCDFLPWCSTGGDFDNKTSRTSGGVLDSVDFCEEMTTGVNGLVRMTVIILT